MCKIEVIFLQLGKLDLTSTVGKLMLSMLASIAEMERGLLVERTRSGLAGAKAEGKILGRLSKTTLEQRPNILTKYAAAVSVSEFARQNQISRANVPGIMKA